MPAFAEYRIWKHALLWLGVFLVLAARVPLLWQGDQFTGEDGWVFFAEAFNSSATQSIFTPFAGYFRFDARILAELLLLFPLGPQPQLYGLAGLALNALVISAFYLRVFRSFLLSDTLRTGVVLLLALAPNAENLGLIAGLHWYLGLAFVLVLLAGLPEGRVGRIGVTILMVLAVWSSPSLIVLLPWLIVRAIRTQDRFERRWYGAAAGQLLLAILAWWSLKETVGERTGSFGFTEVPAALEVLLLRGWLGVGVMGQGAAGPIAGQMPLALSLVGLVIAAALLMWCWHHRGESLGKQVIFLLSVAGFMAVLSLGRTAYISELAGLNLPRHERYLTLPTLLLLLGLWGVVFHIFRNRSRRLMIALWSVQAGLLVVGLSKNQHWSREVSQFAWQEHVQAVIEFRDREMRGSSPASLYLPSDIPYWGIVLEANGGVITPPGSGIVDAIGATPLGDGLYDGWLGKFRYANTGQSDDLTHIYHETMGELTYTGSESGRAWFVAPDESTWFTAPLLQPYWWRIDGLDMKLVEP